jgi:hypothetical protein
MCGGVRLQNAEPNTGRGYPLAAISVRGNRLRHCFLAPPRMGRIVAGI